MKRVFTAIGIVLIFPLFFVTSLFFICRLLQPETLNLAASESYDITSYFDEKKVYALSGDMLFFRDKVYVPESFPDTYALSESYKTSLLSEKHDEGDKVSFFSGLGETLYKGQKSFSGTFAFYIKLPANSPFSLWVPGEYSEYRIFVNGDLITASDRFGEGHPSYPKSFIVDFPENCSSCEVVINIISASNFTNNGFKALFIGSSDKIANKQQRELSLSFFMSAYVLFTIIFLIVQFLAVKSDKRMLPFIFLSCMTVLVTSFMDGRSIASVFPRLPINLGIFIENLATPLYLFALMFFTRKMFEDYFPKSAMVPFLLTMLVPVFNAFTLNRLPLAHVSLMITVIPYAICLYVFVLVFERREPYALAYGIALLSIESSVLLYYATSDMAVPSKYAYSAGYVILSLVMVAIFAHEYATQNTDEQFYSGELARQLEAMQASENAFLNAQMKPHFLYNTLNTIADCCVTDSEKAKKLINSLSEYLKLILSLDNMQKVVPLEHELELARAYTVIEKERFPNINFYEELPLKLPTLTMPPITLQPLIENAIKHGVRKLDKPGVITLRVIDHDNCTEFVVSDNGVGMEKATIDKLFSVPNGNQSIGIYNINKRLKSQYGDGLHVESTPGIGTSICFKIPKKK